MSHAPHGDALRSRPLARPDAGPVAAQFDQIADIASGRLLLRIIGLVAVVEVGVMVALSAVPDLPPVVEALFDAVLLSVAVSPFLVWFVVRPIVRRLQEAAEAERASQAAQAANEAKSQFLANMSHDIRTPLNAIVGMADLLWETELTAEQRDYLRIFRSAGGTLLDLINDILDVSKIEEGKIELESVSFEIAELVEDVTSYFAALAEEKSIELAVRVAPGTPRRVTGDPTRLRQVVTNLVGNAVKFTDEGEVVVQLAPDANQVEGAQPFWLALEVRDTGIGISRDRLEAVFERFTQAQKDTTRHHGGSGLGLTIVRGLVERMGGRVSVESEPGRGTTFRAHVPLLTDVAPAVSDPYPLQGVRALVVDDNDTNRLILRELLHGWGAHAEEAASGLDAVHAGRRMAGQGPLIALLDYRMPDTDGVETARRLKALPGWSGVPMLVLSSGGHPSLAETVREAGIVRCLGKPVRRMDLLQALLGALGRSAAERQDPVAGVPPAERTAPLRILAAEDNRINQVVLQAFFSKTPHSLELVCDGGEAIERVRSEPRIDLVLMDVEMPSVDGLTATREIRAWEASAGSRRIPVIALTGHAGEEVAQQCLEAGCDQHLTKPVTRETLMAAIRRVVGPVPQAE